MSHNTRNRARADRKSSKTPKLSAKEIIDEIVRNLRPRTRCYHCGRHTTMNSYFDAYSGRVYPPICYDCLLLQSEGEIPDDVSISLWECSEELLEQALANPFISPYGEPPTVWN